MLPLGLLNAAQGHPMLVELKNGETLNGHLVTCDTWMNLTLKEVVQTSPDGDKFFRLPEVYVKGNNIKYLRVPDEIIDLVKDQQGQQGNYRGGRGGVRGVLRSQGNLVPNPQDSEGPRHQGRLHDGCHRQPVKFAGTRKSNDELLPPWAAICCLGSQQTSNVLLPAIVSSSEKSIEVSCVVHVIRLQGYDRPLQHSVRTPCLNSKRRPLAIPSRRSAARSVQTEATIRRHLARTQRISLGTKVLSSGEAILQHLIPRSAAEGEVEPYTNLHDVPKAYLHDVLRQIRNEEGAYNKVTDLVRYLIKARGEKPTSLHYDALLRANSDAALGSATAVADLLQDMKDLGIAPDSGLYHSALQALAVHPDYLLRSAVLREMKDRWFTLTPDGWHNVVVGLLRDRQFEIALDKLEEMQAGGIRVQPWLYDIFIYILCEAQELAEALKILRSRVESGDTDISSNVWQYMLDACSNQFYYPGTLYIWRQRVSSSYLIPSDGTCTAVLNTAARACDSDLATDVVRILAQRTSKLEVHHYEALLAAYVGRGDLRTALRILCIMKKARLEPSEGATRPIFTYLMSSRDAKGEDQQTSEPPAPLRAWTILTELQEEGHPIPVAAANVVLSAASNTTSLSLESTIELYKQLHTICSDGPNTATFNALLQGCSREDKNGRTAKSDAMFLASEMVALGIPADELTYDRLVLICLGGEGNEADGTDGLEDALRYVDEMRGTLGRILPSPAAAAAAAAPTMRGDMGPHSGANKGAPLRMGTWNLLVKRCAELGDERVWALLDEMAQLRFGTQRLRAAVEERWRTRSREMERTQSVQGWRGGHEEGLEWMLPRDT